MTRFTFKSSNTIVFISIIFIVLVFYSPIVFQGKSFGNVNTLQAFSPWTSVFGDIDEDEFKQYGQDIIRHYYPWKKNFSKSIEDGEFPFWDRHSYSGFSNIMNPYYGVFYPSNYLAGNSNWLEITSYWFIFERILFWFFIFFAARTIGLSIIASFLCSAVTWFGVPFFIRYLSWDGNTLFWFGPAFLCFIKYIISKNNKWLLFISLCLSFSMLAGNLELVLFFVLGLAVLGFIFEYYNNKDNKIRRSGNYILLISGSLILALMMAGISLIPFTTLSEIMQRVGNISAKPSEHIPPFSLITFVSPYFFGINTNFIGYSLPKPFTLNYITSSFYVGIAMIPFIIAGFIHPKSTLQKSFIISSILLIVLGIFSPLLVNLYRHIPIISGMGGTKRIFIIFPILFGFIAGFGVDSIRNNKEGVFPYIKWRKITLSVLIIGLLFNSLRFIFSVIISFFGINKIQDVLVGASKYFLNKTPVFLSNTGNAGYQWLSGGSNIQEVFVTVVFPLLVNLLLFYILFNKVKLNKYLNNGLLPSFVIIELLIVQSAYLDYIEPKDLFPKTDGMEKVIELQKKSDSPIPYRVASIWHRGPEGTNAAAPYRMLEYYGLEQAGGYSSLYSKYYKEFVNAVEHPDNLDNLNTHHSAAINFGRFDSKLSNYLSIKYVLTAPEVKIEELNNSLIYEGDDLWIYENKNVLPRVFLSSNAVPYNSAREVFEKLLEPDFDPHKTVLVDNEYFQQINNQSNIGQGMELPPNDAINVTKYSSNETELIIHSTNEQFLVLLDNNIPGWQCFINGRKVKIGRAYNTFQTVKIMPGISNVHFKYIPPNLKEGIILSSVGFVIFFILFGAITLKSRKRIVHH